MKTKINWKVLVVSFIIVHFVALAGSLVTNADTSWYESIKPNITPPSIVFPIVWSILFILISISLYFLWINAKKKQRKQVAFIFGINLILNALWSYLFFGLQKPLFAFYDIILLWISIVGMLVVSYKINKASFYMLIPYFLWVSFASYLNWLIAFG